MTGARAINSLAPGRKRLRCSGGGADLPPPHPPPPPPPTPSQEENDDDWAGLLENPLPARPTHLNLGGGMLPEETRRPSGPNDDAVFLLVSILLLRAPDDSDFPGRGEERSYYIGSFSV
jgi:hypothetical protein